MDSIKTKPKKKEKTERAPGEKFVYTNRELSWLDFNQRVLDEAHSLANPTLERLKFLAITASNLDEFYMVRVANLKEQQRAKVQSQDPAGLSVPQQVKLVDEKAHAFMEKQYACLNEELLPALAKEGIHILKPAQLDKEQACFVQEYFDKVMFPVVTPLAVDPSRPFPFLANRSLNLAVRLVAETETVFAVVQVPGILPRWVELPSEEGRRCFLPLEEILRMHLGRLFELHSIEGSAAFRITRDSDFEIDDDADDLLREVQKSLQKRKRGRPIRLELEAGCDEQVKKFLTEALEVKERDIVYVNGPVDLSAFMKLSGIQDSLRYTPYEPVPAVDFWDCEDMFAAIREKDRMVHHPYESFDCVVRFIEKAAQDPNVLAIKQTLYRVSGQSPIIAALIHAAENGKQVTVLVELKARFDEENNILWARKLEQAGCHVIYGLSGLKTHCKILLVVRREPDGIRRYLHMGTGNYNDSTARLYTDIGMFTCREPFGVDASSLFNVLTGYSRPPIYNRFVVAPEGMREFFYERIETEIQNAKAGLPSGIVVKVNSLLDEELIRRLYAASQQGVQVKMIVRGICSLVPGVEGISENIQVISIVGRFLEHSRIFRFENGGSPVYYLGSADWMPRNLDRRVELVFPVEDEDLQQRVESILQCFLDDTSNARMQLNNGSYVPVPHKGKTTFSSQKELMRRAKEEARAARSRVDDYAPITSV